MEKPILVERYSDNGTLSHYELINNEQETIWSQTDPDNRMDGVSAICIERAKQIEIGLDRDHDKVTYHNSELIRAACAIGWDSPSDMPATIPAPDWAWAIREKYADNLPKRLQIMGALVAAQIDIIP